MIKTYSVILGFFTVQLLSSLAIGQEQPKHAIDIAQEEAIKRDPSTSGMVNAIGAAAAQWDELMNLNYQGLMKQLDAEGQTKLRASQKQWIIWRDLEIAALGAIYSSRSGTIWRTLGADAVMDLTKKRALALGYLRNGGMLGGFTIDVQGKPVEITTTSGSADIKAVFRIVAPGQKPSVDIVERLQYDLVLVPDQGSASFVFDFDDNGLISEIIVDAFTKEQNPTVEKLIKQLNQNAGLPSAKNDALVWDYAGWVFTHDEGGEGEDSTYMIRISK